MDIQWSLVIFTVLTGLGGWLFFFVGLNVLLGKTDKGAFAGTVAALALAIVGGCASVTHLSHPDRMLVALQHPTSGIFTEAVLVGLLCITLVAFLVMLRRSIAGTPLKAVAIVGAWRWACSCRSWPVRATSWTPSPRGTPSCCRSATWAPPQRRARRPTSCSSRRRRPTNPP